MPTGVSIDYWYDLVWDEAFGFFHPPYVHVALNEVASEKRQRFNPYICSQLQSSNRRIV